VNSRRALACDPGPAVYARRLTSAMGAHPNASRATPIPARCSLPSQRGPAPPVRQVQRLGPPELPGGWSRRGRSIAGLQRTNSSLAAAKHFIFVGIIPGYIAFSCLSLRVPIVRAVTTVDAAEPSLGQLPTQIPPIESASAVACRG